MAKKRAVHAKVIAKERQRQAIKAEAAAGGGASTSHRRAGAASRQDEEGSGSGDGSDGEYDEDSGDEGGRPSTSGAAKQAAVKAMAIGEHCFSQMFSLSACSVVRFSPGMVPARCMLH